MLLEGIRCRTISFEPIRSTLTDFGEAEFFQTVVRLAEIHLVEAVNLDTCIGQRYQFPSTVSNRHYPHEWASTILLSLAFLIIFPTSLLPLPSRIHRGGGMSV